MLVLVGLPGDTEHSARFRKFTRDIYANLVARGFPQTNIRVLHDRPKTPTDRIQQISKESITTTAKNLVETLNKDDVFWLVMIGHADHDGEHARFHLPGPDLRAVDYADLFEDLKCKEQVFWITTSSSGWFTEPLSKPNRVIVSATAREPEPNETEFPYAFIQALGSPDKEIDQDGDGDLSVLELFAKTHEWVEKYYDADQRAPTEHATLDDSGDGKGTEWKEIFAEIQRIRQLAEGNATTSFQQLLTSKLREAKIDGRLASSVIVPNRVQQEVDTGKAQTNQTQTPSGE